MHEAFGSPPWLPVEVLFLSVEDASTHFTADVTISRSVFFLCESTHPIHVLGFHHANKQVTRLHFSHLKALLWEFLK